MRCNETTNRAPGGECLPAKPPAIIPIGVVVGAIDPDPHAIPEHPIAVVKVVIAIVVALREATITVAVVMAAVAVEGLYVSTTHVALVARAIEVPAKRSKGWDLQQKRVRRADHHPSLGRRRQIHYLRHRPRRG